jgi:hypothetical protein
MVTVGCGLPLCAIASPDNKQKNSESKKIFIQKGLRQRTFKASKRYSKNVLLTII